MNFVELNKKLFKIFTASIIIAVVVLVSVDIRGFGATLMKFNFLYIPLILGLVLLNYFLRFFKWNYYLRKADINVDIKDSAMIFLSSVPMTITPGKVGEFLKSYLLKVKYNYPISTTSPLVIAERMTDSMGMLILAGIGALSFNFGIGLLIFILAAIILGIVIIQSKKLCHGFIGIIAKIPFIKKYVPFLTNFYESACSLFKVRILVSAIIIGIAAWIVEGFIVFLAIKGTGIDISITYSIFILAMSSVAGAVSMLPGGVIASEGSILVLLLGIGIEKGSTGFITLLIRIATLWLGVIVGSFVLLRVEKTLFKESELGLRGLED